jgi:hypothetical protein
MPNEMTREEHLQWCKHRALEYLDQGDLKNAVASMGSDLGKHEETRKLQPLTMLGMHHLMKGDAREVRRWIEGFQ